MSGQIEDTAPNIAPIEEDARRVRLVFAGVMLGMFLAALDQTIVSTALPTIVGDLGGANHLSWVVTAYLLASTATTPLWGKLGDLFGRKALFQICIVLFLAGSALCGVSRNMPQLIGFRAFQGIGGGGLMVLAMAVIADVVPPRDRGRYQGVIGAVFGVSSVLGPLLGGFLVDNLSWRWVFYVNLPVGAVALFVIAVALTSRSPQARPRIDYAGTALLAAASTCLVLITSLGGTTWAWNSPEVWGCGIGAVVLLLVFVLVEQRAPEPILPLRLFRNPVFSMSSAIGFVVGLCMFGALSFIPLFMQVVNGNSPTESGLRLLPMMAGVLVGSIGTGQLISRLGRYKIYPIFGTLFMAFGLALLSRVDEHTSGALMGADMAVFGFGLGLTMQVLIIAVQNTVGYADLGTATSGATYFRSIGGSFGASIFGTILNNRLHSNIGDALANGRLSPQFPVNRIVEAPTAVHQLPAPLAAPFLHIYAISVQKVFLIAVPITLVAFVLTLFLREVPLRDATRVPEPGEASGLPTFRSSLDEIENALTRLTSRQNLWDRYDTVIARAGVDITVPQAYGLFRLHHAGPITDEVAARRLGLPLTQIRAKIDDIIGTGHAQRDGDGTVTLTPSGVQIIDQLCSARTDILQEQLAGWSPEQHADLLAMLRQLADNTLDAPNRTVMSR
ncbi:MAG TPA: MFS transporter [Actinocrinis sp.]|uniref:MFS transporter n=1 Tax=Actinocrinis sp. TaxID=1920516 RepID=UPI002DDCDE47|nr:MFS transporter [Actinocrinis sp.]HEV2344887.1 MFS transporter [Actinocrinis sp.]